ncbi:hypothetical protein EX30DRAFT_205072 [Ascodesmis nigricans]|uniref:DRBM domain-containing protein n=1 Tax=Ascodesmis nigricans TaxID=341454 RepID=A0A4S2MK41_9PEZI|nr:hypothetical protein EX30DRAFT_205072 [Ascodesmis nigricans]
MFYILYLSSLCQRRRWPDPLYETSIVSTSTYDRYGPIRGYTCSVRVNHRIYESRKVFETEELAKEEAAKEAYYICRSLSIAEQTNDLPPLVGGNMGPGNMGPGYFQPQHATTGGGWGGRRNS